MPDNMEMFHESTSICNVVTPVGMLGYSLHEDQAASLLEQKQLNGAPTAIILDSGSTDSGPEKLALGCMTAPRDSYVRDLQKLIRLSRRFRVPLIFSSAGGDGSDEHVRELAKIVEEIASHDKKGLKVISIFSGINKMLVADRLEQQMISGCGKPVPSLTQEKIDATPRIVAQMGPEPILDAMLANPDFDVLIAGRAYDPAPYIAFAAFASRTSIEDTSSTEARHLWGGFAHMGKILECGGVCAIPKSNGAAATVYQDGTFDVTPLDPDSRCTPISVAAHTLYEKSRPDLLYGPGGYIDLANMKTEALEDGRTVRVQGARFHFSKDEGLPYTVKLEGAEVIGYRAQMMGSLKDPTLIKQLDSYLERIQGYVRSQFDDTDVTWKLGFHLYGQHQVSTLSVNEGQPSEIFLIGEALAPTQEVATSVASLARIAIIHAPYPGQKATSGNLAYGLGGQMQIALGPCAQFSIYHLMELKEGEERLHLSDESPGIFTQEVVVFGGADVAVTVPTEAPATTNGKQKALPRKPALEPLIVQSNPRTLGDISNLLRSKNAGPYEITLDVMFDSEARYRLVKDSNLLTAHSMAKLFGISEDDILWIGFFDQALAYKVTIPRLRNGKPTASGGFMENDVHGSQHYIGLMNLALPEDLVQRWNALSPVN